MNSIKKVFTNEKLILVATVIAGVILFSAYVHADDVSTQVIVGNATPSLSSTTFNSGAAITLTENTTTTVYATTTVTDSNGCSEITSVVADFYRTTITESGCDTAGEADNNNCYSEVTCTAVAGTCTGGSDTSGDYVCSVALQYYADPTDSGSHSATDWSATFEASDGTASSTTDTANAELNALLSLDVTSSIDFGTLSANSDSGATNETTTVTNTGNVAMDPELSGTNLTSGGDTILVGNQEYSATAFTYGAGTDLTGSAVGLDLSLAQPTSGTAPVQDDIEWGIGVDNGQPTGTYTGTNTIGAATAI